MVESTRKQYFVGGNWKSNGTQAFLKDLIENTLNKVEYDPTRVRKCLMRDNTFRGLHRTDICASPYRPLVG